MNVDHTETTTIPTRFAQMGRVTLLALFLTALAVGIGLAVAHQMSLVVVFMVSLILLTTLLTRPDAATPFVVFLIYSNVIVLGVRFHGFPPIVSVLIPAMLLLPLFYHLVIRREKLILPRSLPWVALFMITIMVSTILSDNFAEAFSQLIVYFTEGFFLYVLITNVIRSSQQMRLVIWSLLLAGILMGGVPLYQQATGTFNNSYGGLAQISDATFRTGDENLQGDVRQPRLAGAIGEMNRFAQVMLILVPLGLFRFWGETSRPLRLVALLATVLSGLGMVLAFSRGAAVAFGFMILLMAVFRIIKPVQLFAFFLVAGLLLLALPQYSARILSIQSITGFFTNDVASEETSPDGAIEGRATVMLAAARVYADNPVFGVGPGVFKFYARQYSQDLGLRNLTGDREAHSLYLGLAAETGSLGIFFFLAMLTVTIRDLLRVRKRSRGLRPDLENLATSFILVLLAYLTTGMFLHLSYMRYFWLIFALASAASTIAMQELGQPSPEPARIQAANERVI